MRLLVAVHVLLVSVNLGARWRTEAYKGYATLPQGGHYLRDQSLDFIQMIDKNLVRIQQDLMIESGDSSRPEGRDYWHSKVKK